MKILTWNILASEWIKKSYYPTVKDQTLFKRDKRMKIIVAKLKEESADIVFLQEVMSLEYNVLHKELKQYHFSSLAPIQWYKSKKSDSGNITLVKKGSFRKWTETAFDYGIYVNVDQLHLFNVHLDDVSYYKRKKQLDQLPLKDKHVILAGDFNQSYKKESYLYDIPGFTIHNYCDTYFVEKRMNIDNILTKGFMVSSNVCSYVPTNVEEGLTIYGSDHIPVTATVY